MNSERRPKRFSEIRVVSPSLRTPSREKTVTFFNSDVGRDIETWKKLWQKLLKERRMQKLVDTVMESQRFFEDYSRQKEKDAEEYKEKDPPPVFNKRLYVSTGSVVITSEARRIMARNRDSPEPETLSKSDLMIMRSVVDGLKLIHKGHDYIKDALSHVITFETHPPHQYIVKRDEEDCLSCYFIVQGAVEVTYDMRTAETRSVYQPNIIYNHGTGEFLGLVSAEGLREDLSPPGTIYTKEKCDFLRIDRERFHTTVARYGQVFDKQKRIFMSLPHCVLSRMPPDAKDKILDKIYRQEFPPNRQVLLQGDSTEFLHFVYSGRCKLHREIIIPEAEKKSKFFLRACEEGSYFGEECILDREGSYCTVTTATHTVIFKLQKSAFEVVSKEHLHNLIGQYRHEYPDDSTLRDRGYTLHTWNDYKHNAVRSCLEERGHLKYMCSHGQNRMRSRPPTACDRNKENLYRFMEKGAQYEPMRTRNVSAKPRSGRALLRPRTAIGLRHSTPLSNHRTTNNLDDENDSDDIDEDEEDDDLELSGSITQLPSDMARLLAKHVGKQLPKDKLQQLLREGDCRELLKLLDESSEVGKQLRMALEAPSSQEGFTKTTVLMTMKTDDIVRKAKELAVSKTDNHGNGDADDGKEWNTILHEENRTAKIQIAADKFRISHLRRKMRALDRKRESLRHEKEATQVQSEPGQTTPLIHHISMDIKTSVNDNNVQNDISLEPVSGGENIIHTIDSEKTVQNGDSCNESRPVPKVCGSISRRVAFDITDAVDDVASSSVDADFDSDIGVLHGDVNERTGNCVLNLDKQQPMTSPRTTHFKGQGHGQTRSVLRKVGVSLFASNSKDADMSARLSPDKHRQTSDNSLQTASTHRRKSAIQLLEKSFKRRPISAPMYWRSSTFGGIDRKQDYNSRLFSTDTKGRLLTARGDNPGPPSITHRVTAATQTTRSPRGKISRR